MPTKEETLKAIQDEFYKMQLEKQKVQAEMEVEHMKLHADLLKIKGWGYPYIMKAHEVEITFDGN